MIENGTTIVSLEDLVAMFVAALEMERAQPWRAGDIVNRACDHATDQVLLEAKAVLGTFVDELPARLRRKVNGAHARLRRAFATAASSTTAHIRQLGHVAGSFGTEQRFPMRPWTWFRAVLNAARRSGRDARELADEAHRLDWSVATLNAYGKGEPGPMLRADYDCPTCGCSITVKAEGQAASRVETADAVLWCPVCVDVIAKAGGDPREATRLGGLEAA